MGGAIHTVEDLAALDLLQTPVWIVDLERATQWWDWGTERQPEAADFRSYPL